MLEFICATFNEDQEIDDLLNHVYPYVDRINIVDDVSTDNTTFILDKWWNEIHEEQYQYQEPTQYIPEYDRFTWHQMEQHTGLPETVKKAALQVCEDDSWVLMLDADERFAPGVLEQIRAFVDGPESEGITHVWFTLNEYIDEIPQRSFLKCRLFKANAIKFSPRVHEDDTFEGNGANFDWVVLHRKTASKQIRRELEYLETYKKLLDSGEINQDRFNTLMGYHYFIKVPHG